MSLWDSTGIMLLSSVYILSCIISKVIFCWWHFPPCSWHTVMRRSKDTSVSQCSGPYDPSTCARFHSIYCEACSNWDPTWRPSHAVAVSGISRSVNDETIYWSDAQRYKRYHHNCNFNETILHLFLAMSRSPGAINEKKEYPTENVWHTSYIVISNCGIIKILPVIIHTWHGYGTSGWPVNVGEGLTGKWNIFV